VISTEFNVYKS